MRFKKPNAATQQVNARVPETLKRRLQALSMQMQRSESDLARQAIECWINDREFELKGDDNV